MTRKTKAARIGKSGAAHASDDDISIVIDPQLIARALDQLRRKYNAEWPMVQWQFFADEKIGWLLAGITAQPSLTIRDSKGNELVNLPLTVSARS